MCPLPRPLPVLVMLLSVLAVLPGVSHAARATRLPVVVTFSILGDLVQQVGGEHTAIRVLVGPDTDAHTYEPIPADGVALTHAAVLFELGLGFEPWLEALYRAARTTAQRVVATQGLSGLLRVPGGLAERPGDTDPHVWHDVAYVVQMVQVIRDALKRYDAPHAAAYEANAARYLDSLQQLDTWVQQHVATLPAGRRKLVTAHDTFGYFARRYGFEVLGTVLESFTTEAADPSGAALARLVDTIKATGVPAIFAENIQHPRRLQHVAASAGVTLAPALYTDALGRPGSAGAHYLAMMRHNVTTIVQALQP
ncbi:MAG: metal ABC transporter substrate-binding protein [Candidatus Tectomicrobia bacterium]|uniref:Metal ABC transporter substrate-binding protein n=1 Tax=Tectimicrobiota bacterium TaxID=2528274 RepID=A0A938B4K7_UNCTE|nr:metal ABC transporter substrate-binding protein [Candidatus Tectomicrobia bacterium]